MSEANDRTLGSYNNKVDKYINGTVQETKNFQKEWLDSILKKIPVDASILEIGSAFGRDAKYLRGLGYQIYTSDAAKGFIEYLRSNGFPDAVSLDIVKQRPSRCYDVVLASAVFLHFTNEDFDSAVRNVRNSLNDQGIFAFSVKQGEGEEWTDSKLDSPRFFKYWQVEDLQQRLSRLGMYVIDIVQYNDKDTWIHVVSRSNGEEAGI